MSSDNSSRDIDLIFEEWEASLKERDKSSSAVEGNFQDLFQELKDANVPFEEAHDILFKAIKAHLPAPAVIRATYKTLKSSLKVAGLSEKEYAEGWNKNISNSAKNAFFEIYPRPKKEGTNKPKMYGKMTEKEHKALQLYVDQFPIIDTEELGKRLHTSGYNPLEDIDNILDKKKWQP